MSPLTRCLRAFVPSLLALIALVWLPVRSGDMVRAQTPAQTPAPATPQQDKAAAFKKALAANQAALKQYTWVETTQVLYKGEVKKQDQKQCAYGADGKVQKTPIPGAAPAPPPQQEGGRRLKKDIVEHKVEETKEYMDKVVALVHQYVPPSSQKIQAAEAAGNLSITPATGTTTMTVKNYVKDGDSVALGFDPATKKLVSYKVVTYVEKPGDDDVSLNVTFGALTGGPSYPQNILLEVPSKKIEVKVTNADYKKTGS